MSTAHRVRWLAVATAVFLGVVVALLIQLRTRRGVKAEGSARELQQHAPVPASIQPGQIEPTRIDRDLPPDMAAKARAWSPTTIQFEPAKPGQTAPARNVRIGEYDPTRPGAPPNPFIPPKKQITMDEAQAGHP